MPYYCVRCEALVEASVDSVTGSLVCVQCGSTMDRAADNEQALAMSTTGTWEKSTKTLGPYELLEQVGGGAFGTVYRARHPGLDKLVALKVLHRFEGTAVQRFRLEAIALGQIDHGAVVKVFDSGQSGDGRWYIVSEYISGPDLKRWLKRNRTVPPRVAAEWAARLTDGLVTVHTRGIYHRDIKPSNIMLRPTGRGGSLDGVDFEPVLMDFGLARKADENLNLTEDGLIGTPSYMSPEQFRNSTTTG